MVYFGQGAQQCRLFAEGVNGYLDVAEGRLLLGENLTAKAQASLLGSNFLPGT
jgi:hypothetical protein